MKSRIIVFVVLMLCHTLLIAAPHAIVDAVQMPVWLERDGASSPLSVGAVLQNSDTLRTGKNGRILLRLAEGSQVKLGENAVLKLDSLAQQAQGQRLFTASLEVLQGAFRFTTNALGKLRHRDVKVRIATVTAGIRGTDLWGKASSEKDIVCLIEGKISVNRGNESFEMQDPLSFYIAPKNAPALPVAPVPAEQLKEWSLETEIAAGQGARRDGKWKANMATVDQQSEALAIYDTLRNNGYAAEIRPGTRAQTPAYTVSIAHLSSQAEARVLADRLSAELGLSKATITR